ncbi:Thiol:disulfide interchange protein DsbD [Nonlabens sp. Hel1_33_55]|uniref:protein-disulfide reductase DsbD family protein n=1 Tax=Nonlabens sp. Hel1_33_55 TaxID=1336802 RepID=UPI000875C3EC|nr:cytochrome c biogenesis protein CcdA [Nonlabens sp. Hel1_33_55]SCX93809.1 Thiol:disulfide interchange protein DsbD [Nonlabens sp. Hel1_33_55]
MEYIKSLLLALLVSVGFISSAQILDPASWSVKVNDLGDDTYELVSTAQLEPGWHIYSQFSVGAGNIPTEFRFYEADNRFQLDGPNQETGTYKEYTEVFGADVYQFKDFAIFKQKVRLLNKDVDYILAEAIYQACDDEKCLPPSPEVLVFKIDPQAVVDEDVANIIGEYYDNDIEPLIATAPDLSNLQEKESNETQASLSDDIEKDNENDLTTIFILCLLAGFGALLTPCVYPMIPMTVSFFTKQNEKNTEGKFQGILYGLFILLIYVLCSLPFHLFESISPDIFNEFSTNPYLNIFFFIIFVVFAISFFGAFEITMPTSLINKVDKASNIGGVIGIFFMALTLVLVSFSCTGPVIGSVLGSVLSSDGGATALTVGLAGFGFGLGIPFALFAIFPSWLTALPKSGGWLNTVKVFLGFLELAFAFKFLSNADLVWQAGWLQRELFIAIWIAIFGALAIYLFGKIRLPHDDKDQPISVGRLLLGILSLCFTLYLIPGLWGAPLKLISGFTPPMTYSESPYGFSSNASTAQIEIPDGAHLGVHDIITFDNYTEGLAYANQVGKPALIDFTGWACVNCRKMEERVWGEPVIKDLLKNDFILISLYVDERADLEPENQYISDTTGKKIRTVGNKWSDFQIERYQVNAQPFYAIVDDKGNDLVEPVGYTPDVDDYKKWLESGLNK